MSSYVCARVCVYVCVCMHVRYKYIGNRSWKYICILGRECVRGARGEEDDTRTKCGITRGGGPLWHKGDRKQNGGVLSHSGRKQGYGVGFQP